MFPGQRLPQWDYGFDPGSDLVGRVACFLQRGGSWPGEAWPWARRWLSHAKHSDDHDDDGHDDDDDHDDHDVDDDDDDDDEDDYDDDDDDDHKQDHDHDHDRDDDDDDDDDHDHDHDHDDKHWAYVLYLVRQCSHTCVYIYNI